MTWGGEAALAALERRIGHEFANRELLLTALTHASAKASGRGNYERFEFLGDRVLGLVIAEMLVAAFPGATEGELSQRLADLVRLETCAEVAAEIDLGNEIKAAGVKFKDARERTNILGDACEAVIAAVYLDGGLEPAKRFIEARWRERMLRWGGAPKDAKTTLQEWAQGRGLAAPVYAIVGRSGPDHAPLFEVEVRVETLPSCRGEGRSRREAEQGAASVMLVRQGLWKDAGNAA